MRAQKQQRINDRKEAQQVERQLQDEVTAIAIATTTPARPKADKNRPIPTLEDEVHTGGVEQAVGRPSRARRAPKHLEGYEL